MKKVLFSLMVVCACTSFSCTKSNNKDSHDYSNNRVISEYTGATKTSSCFIRIEAGHRSSDCGGKCIQINGTDTHADCMGFGDYCPLMSSVTLQQSGSNITATTTDTFGLTSEDFFAMPDRSLYFYTDENNNRVFLNIPSQLVFRDTVTKQFTFTRLFLTNAPEYSNN